MLNRWHREIEADLAYKGVDLLDFWRGKITLRRMAVLIDGLPRDSAFRRAQLGWPDWLLRPEDILAHIADLLAGANWQRSYNPERPSPHPTPFPRPGDAERREAEQQERVQRLLALEESSRGGV